MLAKIFLDPRALFALVLVVTFSGCTPAGPRALLQGKKYLDQGNDADAVVQFKSAATLLATNAAAWNYYGVALQRAGQADEAVNAYQNALKCDRDLAEAHFNLGSLWLEQNKPEAARTEFMAYTLQRKNDPAGWQKLGSAQLRLGETVPAEKSFSTVLYLKPADAEAYNGLGFARIQRGHAREAMQFFAAAIQSRPDFAPAILNQATTAHQYLRDDQTALQYYHSYLALTPRPANWDEVSAIVATLEQSQAPAPPPALPVVTAPLARPNPPVVVAEVKPPAKTPAAAPRSGNPAEAAAKSNGRGTLPVAAAVNIPPPQPVTVAPAPPIVTTPVPVTLSAPIAAVQGSSLAQSPTAVPEVPFEPDPAKPNVWHKLKLNPVTWFGPGTPDNPTNAPYLEKGLTPLPSSGGEPVAVVPARPVETTAAPSVEAMPAPMVRAPVVNFVRYSYLSPRPPVAGDRRAASGAFTKARLYEQEEKWPEAMEWYQQAAEMDPTWFEAQYNAGVLAHRLRNYQPALASYEAALAVQPDSVDARYNFALALKAAGYALDAADELKKLLSEKPREVRAHLALANLEAQSLHDPGLARLHYLKVLELDPANAQGSDIRFWLSANPQ